MLRTQIIDSLDAPELAPYRTLRRQFDHQRNQIFVAEGDKIVRRLLQSQITVVSLLLPPAWIEPLRPLAEARAEMIHAYVAEKALLEQLTGFALNQGVMAVARVPTLPTLDEVLATSPNPHLFVAADGINNAENLGTLIRNCVAFRVQALLVGETSSNPFLRRTVRSSMGAIFDLPIVDSPNLIQTLHQLRRHHIRCFAAHPRTGQKNITQADLTGDCCIILGHEGSGVSPRVIETCDEAVAIPMPETMGSLNVSSAGAVFLYEVNRQRGLM